MTSGGGVRPNKLWHWFAVAFLVATFLAEPRASAALTWAVFRGAGAVGGELLTGDPEPDVLNLQPDPTPGTGSGQGDRGETFDSGDRFDTAPATGPDHVVVIDGDRIRIVLDHGVDGILALHDRVEAIQDAGGFTVEVGDQS